MMFLDGGVKEKETVGKNRRSDLNVKQADREASWVANKYYFWDHYKYLQTNLCQTNLGSMI